MSLTPDGRFAVSGSVDGTVRVWNIEKGDCIRVFEGHKGAVECVKVTPDCRHVISGSRDGTVRLWITERDACVVFPVPTTVATLDLISVEMIVGLDSGEMLFAELKNLLSGPEVPVSETSFATNGAYEQCLLRGLENCRQTKGDHEDTLGHLVALKVHLEMTGRPDRGVSVANNGFSCFIVRLIPAAVDRRLCNWVENGN